MTSKKAATSINKKLKDSVIKPTLMMNNKKLSALDEICLNENVKKITLAKITKPRSVKTACAD